MNTKACAQHAGSFINYKKIGKDSTGVKGLSLHMLPEGLQSLVSTSSLNSPLQSSQPPLPAQDDLRSEQNQVDKIFFSHALPIF